MVGLLLRRRRNRDVEKLNGRNAKIVVVEVIGVPKSLVYVGLD